MVLVAVFHWSPSCLPNFLEKLHVFMGFFRQFFILLSAIRSLIAERVNSKSFSTKYRNIFVILVLVSSDGHRMQLRIRHRSPAWWPGKAFFKPAAEFSVKTPPLLFFYSFAWFLFNFSLLFMIFLLKQVLWTATARQCCGSGSGFNGSMDLDAGGRNDPQK